jgi:hypothetical protein
MRNTLWWLPGFSRIYGPAKAVPFVERFFRSPWLPDKGRVPHTPDFLRGLLALMNFMPLSSMKAAHVAVAWFRVQEIRVSRSFFARCGIPPMLTAKCIG